MAIRHVRAKNTVTGGVAAISEKALALGMLPGWEAADGPVPSRPKSAVPALRKKTTGGQPEEATGGEPGETADGESADEKQE